MIYTLTQISKSLASYLAPYFEDVTFYEDPIVQVENLPVMFLQTRSASIEKGTAGYYIWTLRLDLVYLLPMNGPELQRQYETAAEILDIVMDHFPYIAPDESTAIVHAENRNWTIDLNELHYKFDIQTRVSKQDIGTLMQSLAQDVEVKDGQEKRA